MQLEAAIVSGSTGSYGAVACIKTVKNPIEAARLVLDSDNLCMLVGEAADKYAENAGLDIVDNAHFTTPKRLGHLEKWKAGQLIQAENLGTVGAVALDSYGNLAAAGSTGGNTCKPLGRIGDTAIIGAGLIANKHAAVAWYVPRLTGQIDLICLWYIAAVMEKLSLKRMWRQRCRAWSPQKSPSKRP